jgi:hypothetical protein
MSRMRVRYATVFVLPPAGKSRMPIVSTTPQRLVARRGDVIEWTVVNASGIEGVVSFTWDKDNPLRGDSSKPFPRRARDTVFAKARKGVYKYSVLFNDKLLFDPEIEIMP